MKAEFVYAKHRMALGFSITNKYQIELSKSDAGNKILYYQLISRCSQSLYHLVEYKCYVPHSGSPSENADYIFVWFFILECAFVTMIYVTQSDKISLI